MIDWAEKVTGPVMRAFGQPAVYTIAGGSTFGITAVYDPAYRGVDAGTGLPLDSTAPVAGVQLSEFPPGFDARNAQGDYLVVTSTGQRFVVKAGKPDGQGWALLELNAKPL